MTEQTVSAAAPAPTVTIPAGTVAMEFATTNPTTGQPLTAHEQFQQRLQNKTWVADASQPGTPANAEFTRLQRQMAVAASGDLGGSTVNAEALAAELRGYGLSPTRVAEEMRRLGVDPGEIPGAGRTAPESFRFPYPAPLTKPEELAADQSARNWLSHAGFDADTGSNFAEAINKLASRNWDEATLKQHIDKGRAALRSVWGAEFEGNVALLDRFIGDVEAKSPGLKDFLDDKPYVLAEPVLAHQLLGMARRRFGGAA